MIETRPRVLDVDGLLDAIENLRDSGPSVKMWGLTSDRETAEDGTRQRISILESEINAFKRRWNSLQSSILDLAKRVPWTEPERRAADTLWNAIAFLERYAPNDDPKKLKYEALKLRETEATKARQTVLMAYREFFPAARQKMRDYAANLRH